MMNSCENRLHCVWYASITNTFVLLSSRAASSSDTNADHLFAASQFKDIKRPSMPQNGLEISLLSHWSSWKRPLGTPIAIAAHCILTYIIISEQWFFTELTQTPTTPQEQIQSYTRKPTGYFNPMTIKTIPKATCPGGSVQKKKVLENSGQGCCEAVYQVSSTKAW